MLEHTPLVPDLKISPDLGDADWCLGDASDRWDVSFTDRLWLSLRRWFARDDGARPLPLNARRVGVDEPLRQRRAA